MKIAILDDDAGEAETIRQVLRAAMHSCEVFTHGKRMLDALGKEPYDMLVINWQVSDGSGAEIVQWSRQYLAQGLPVLFLCSSTREDDIIAALDAGADDYIIKPLRRGELAARVRTLLHRAYPERSTTTQMRFDEYLFEPEPGRLSRAGQPVDLTQKEFDLALLFFRNLGRPLSRAYILETIWSPEADVPSRTLDTHVSRVRNKLGLRPENGYRLVPVYSFGYRLEKLSGPAGETHVPIPA